MTFRPAHGLAARLPLGSDMRARPTGKRVRSLPTAIDKLLDTERDV